METNTAVARDTGDKLSPAEEDRTDVPLAQGGDVRAFERIYRRHVARIHALTRRMLGADLAEEVTQDVFVRAWEKLGTFRAEAQFGTWLHRVAVNVVLARRKKLGIQRERYAADGETAITRFSGRVDRPDLTVDVEAAIETLPPGARQVFVLHDVEGYKHREIAELLGVTSGTTKAQLHRARMMLRAQLAR